MREALGGGELGILSFAWVVPAVVLVVVLGLVFLRFLRDLPRSTRRRLLLAGGLYRGGAVGMEMAGAAYGEAHGIYCGTYSLIATAEEALEFAGLIVLIWAVLRHWAEQHGEVRLRMAAAAGARRATGTAAGPAPTPQPRSASTSVQRTARSS